MPGQFEAKILQVAQEFGTPTYFYDSDIIRKKYRDLRIGLPSYVDIFYSMKANPNIAICEYLRSLGANCEVSSRIEFHTAIQAGFKPEQIIFVGPGKTTDEIKELLSYRIKLFVTESIEEIKMINQLSQEMQCSTPILLRINPHFRINSSPLKMSGVASQFGMNVKTLSEHIHYLKKLKNISIRGIQIYNATRVLHADVINENINKILHLSDELSKIWNMRFKYIDVGGGFGVPYFQDEQDIDIDQLKKTLCYTFEQFHTNHPDIKIILELGRYLVAESGYLITKIQYIKNNHDIHYLIVDAGMHCHMAATGIGSFAQRNFPAMLISSCHAIAETIHEKKLYHVSGPLCTPGDTLLKNIVLPQANIGDLIIIQHSGAYGLTASLTRFLSHGSPAEVLDYHHQLRLIRRREVTADILSTQYSLGES